MPIVCSEHDETDVWLAEYDMPENVLAIFTDEFLEELKDQVDSVFNLSLTSLEDLVEDFTYHYYCISYGFHEAFEDTCKKFDVYFAHEILSELPWYDNDMAMSDVAELLVQYSIKQLRLFNLVK